MLGSDSVFECIVSCILWIRGISGNGLGGDSSDSKILPRRSCSARGSLSARFSRWRVGGERERTGRKIPPRGRYSINAFLSPSPVFVSPERALSLSCPTAGSGGVELCSQSFDGLRAPRRKGGPSESSGNGSDSERVGAGGGSCVRVELRL